MEKWKSFAKETGGFLVIVMGIFLFSLFSFYLPSTAQGDAKKLRCEEVGCYALGTK